MTIEKFQQLIAEGKPLEGTEMITFMREQTAQTRKVLMDLNTNYHTDEEIVGLFCKITGSNVDPTFRMFPPFYTDFGKNIHLGKNVFINSCCQFQDQGGIFIGDGCLIGPGTMMATLNHGFQPEDRQNMTHAPIVIGKGGVDRRPRYHTSRRDRGRQRHHCRRSCGDKRRGGRHDCRRGAGQGHQEHT